MTAKDGLLHLHFDQKPAEPVLLSVYATSGTLVHRQWLTPDSQETAIHLPIRNSGIYAVQLTSQDTSVTGSQLVKL